MKYHVGDMVTLNTEVRPGGGKYILSREPQEDCPLGNGSFQIVSRDEVLQTYKIIIDDDMVGWTISEFHIQHQGVASAFKYKKFWDVTEEYIVRKSK